jgi:hypothetical protein
MILTEGKLSATCELPLVCLRPDGLHNVKACRCVGVVKKRSLYKGGHIVFGAAEHWSVQCMFHVYLCYSYIHSYKRSQNCEKLLLASSCPAVRMEEFGSHWTDFYETLYLSIFMKFDI